MIMFAETIGLGCEVLYMSNNHVKTGQNEKNVDLEDVVHAHP